MKKFRKDTETGKWTDGIIYLSCGMHIDVKYHDEVVTGTIEYSDMWNGGNYLVLDDNQGSLPMFDPVIEGELK